MAVEELQKRLDANTEKIMNNISKINDNEKNIQRNSFALEMLKDSTNEKKRLFIIILVILTFWLLTTGAFLYYIWTTSYEDSFEYANTDNGGNACIGDNCNNGEIYGNSN